MKIRCITLTTALLLLIGCASEQATKRQAPQKTTVFLQPFEDFPQEEAQKLKTDLERHHLDSTIHEKVEIKVLPSIPLKPDYLNDAKTRYQAGKLIRQSGDHPATTILLTHKDISTSAHGRKDWGILGLSIAAKHTCVVSTYRVHPKSNLWRVATHEFIHTRFNYPHCPKNNNACIMQDAKGKPRFSNKNRLCAYCDSIISILK